MIEGSSTLHIQTTFREAMRRQAATVNIITISSDGDAKGMLATAVSSLYFDPPSLVVCVNTVAAMYPNLKCTSHFAVNILHQQQEAAATRF